MGEKVIRRSCDSCEKEISSLGYCMANESSRLGDQILLILRYSSDKHFHRSSTVGSLNCLRYFDDNSVTLVPPLLKVRW